MKAPHQMRPGNRYARENGIGRTLGQLVAAKMALVAVCRRCKHRRVLYPANLIPELRGGLSLPSSSGAPALQRLPRAHGQSP